MSLSAIVSAPVLVKPPTGFRWSSPPLSIYRENGRLFTKFDITSLIPAITTIYYVDPIGGNDANAGTSTGLPLQHLSVALAKSDVDQIQIINLVADYAARTTFAWNNTQPTRSVSVLNRTGFRYISLVVPSSVIPVWTLTAAQTVVYQTASTTANAASVVDLATSTVPTYVNAQGATISLVNVPKRFKTLVNVGSIAAVAATPGTWFCDNTNVYVQSFDSRNLIGDQNMYHCGSSNNGRFPAVNNCTIYVEGIDFVGGEPFFSSNLSTVTGTTLALNKCSFQGSSSQGGGKDGLSVAAFQSVYVVNCIAADNFHDGFGYHSNESNGTTTGTSPSVIEIACVAVGNGQTGSGGSSDNASTGHDQCNVIRLNTIYIDSADRALIDIDNCHSWNLGLFVGQSTIGNTGGESIVIGGGVNTTVSKMWIDSCYAPAGTFPQWASITPTSGSAVLNYFNSGAVVNSGSNTGTVTPYVG